MKKILITGLALFALAMSFQACDESTTKHENQVTENTEKELVLVKAPEFNADSAFYFIEKQVNFGPRVPNSQAHQACGDFLLETLNELGAKIDVQNFTATAYDDTKLEGRNIIGSINPEATKRILLTAHWDTRRLADKDADEKLKKTPIDGANDGASGVAVILEILRTIKQSPEKPNIGIDVIFFDLEDDGAPDGFDYKGDEMTTWCHGSQYWAKNKHKENYSAFFGILLDMVGAKNAKFKKESYSLHFAESVVHKVWAIANKLGYGNHFLNQKTQFPDGGGLLDDHLFVNQIGKIPMIDIIDYDTKFGDYHHTQQDNIKIIDKDVLKAVGQTVLQVIYQEAK